MAKRKFVAYSPPAIPRSTSRPSCCAALVAGGADLIELGVPFSDPMADGPVLQRAAGRAIRAGTTLSRVLEMVATERASFPVPIVLFGYYNPYLRYGIEAVARDAKAAGIDGFLCVDLPPEDRGPLAAALERNGLDLIRLLAPTTPVKRVATIAKASSGFLYFVSVLGVTGARSELPQDLPALVERVRGVTSLPIGVGFGVQTPEQARWIAGFADAVIVGSAIQRLVEEHGQNGAPAKLEAVRAESERRHAGGARLGASRRGVHRALLRRDESPGSRGSRSRRAGT
jgi:tryptophan synthase alpha chain